MTNLTPLALRLAQAHAGGGWETVARVVEEMVADARQTALTEVLEIVHGVAPPDSYYYANDRLRIQTWESAIARVASDLRAFFDAGKDPAP